MTKNYTLEIIYDPTPDSLQETLRFYINGERVYNEDPWIWFHIGNIKNEFNFSLINEYGSNVFKATLYYETALCDLNNQVEIFTNSRSYDNLHFICSSIVAKYHNELTKKNDNTN